MEDATQTSTAYADGVEAILSYLKATYGLSRRSVSDDVRYCGISDVILRHGRQFKPGPAKLPSGLSRGELKQCFSNAQSELWHDQRLTYVEGYAMSIIPVHHGWLVDDEGRVLELTWREPGSAYIGVPIKRDYVIEMARTTKYWSALFDNWAHHPPQPIISGHHAVDKWLDAEFKFGDSL